MCFYLAVHSCYQLVAVNNKSSKTYKKKWISIYLYRCRRNTQVPNCPIHTRLHGNLRNYCLKQPKQCFKSVFYIILLAKKQNIELKNFREENLFVFCDLHNLCKFHNNQTTKTNIDFMLFGIFIAILFYLFLTYILLSDCSKHVQSM